MNRKYIVSLIVLLTFITLSFTWSQTGTGFAPTQIRVIVLSQASWAYILPQTNEISSNISDESKELVIQVAYGCSTSCSTPFPYTVYFEDGSFYDLSGKHYYSIDIQDIEPKRFVLKYIGNIDDDPFLDVFLVDDEGNVFNYQNDLTDRVELLPIKNISFLHYDACGKKKTLLTRTREIFQSAIIYLKKPWANGNWDR